MHIVVLVLGVLAGAAFWWYRIKTISEAGSEVVDALGRVRGQVRRNKLRQKSEESPVVAIDNPVIAAATLLINLITTSPMTPVQEEVVREQLGSIAAGEELDEAIIYGRWVQTQALDSRKATLMLVEKLSAWLSVGERDDVMT